MKIAGQSAVTLDTQTLAALVMELASQLHIERARRIALEEALVSASVLEEGAVRAAGSDPAVREHTQAMLQVSLRKLMQVLTEDRDPRTPLRHRSPGDSLTPS